MSARRRVGPFSIVGYWVALGLREVARILPWPVLRAFGVLVGRMGYLLDGRHRRIALDGISRCFPEKTPAEHRRIARVCYRHVGVSVMEFARLATASREEILRRWGPTPEQSRRLDELAAERPAPIFLAGHIGFWEMCALGFTAHGGRLGSVVRPLDNPWLNDLVSSVRSRFGLRILGGGGALLAAMHSLKEGVPVSFLLDQNAGPDGTFVPLFGRLASTRPTAAQVALATGSAIVCVATWREEPSGVHRLRIGNVLRPGKWRGPKDQRYEAEVRRLTAGYTAEIEAAVREHPEQWLWLHRRWKARPPGEAPGA